MKKSLIALIAFVPLALSAAPFGNKVDIEYAQRVWDVSVKHSMVGENSILTRPYKGMIPHGTILELLEKDVEIADTKGALVVKRNYGGDGISIDDVINNPSKFLKSITIMFKREVGYDDENKNWFYAKYTPQGELMKNPKDMPLAGRVAKGAPTGCIACHRAATGDDFHFNHDRYK